MIHTASLPPVPPARRLPASGKAVPTATYRLQLGAGFTFADAAQHVDYYASLGVSHLYLSPILQAAPGSTHGYDVVDHAQIWDVLGGRDGLTQFAHRAHEAGLGLIADIVPNHMGVPTPAWHNRQLWSVLAQGQASPYAHWFDIDWGSGDNALLMPLLGDRIGTVLARGELSTDTIRTPAGDEHVLRYWDHVLPIRPGTENLPLADLVSHQHYRLCYWRVADEELNYRRFFDVGSLVAVRVEQEDVFAATHELIIDLVREGTIDGLRVDHVDGLADPGAYLDALYAATEGAWIVVEKILAPDEPLAPGLRCAGTTGYETCWRLGAVHTDPAGLHILSSLMREVAGDSSEDFDPMVRRAKAEVIAGPLLAEVNRLSALAADVCAADVRLRDHTQGALRDCLVELLVAADRYRYYTDRSDATAENALQASAERARRSLPLDKHDTLDVILDLLLGREVGSAGQTRRAERDEFIVRFQQTCGAVHAKGVEDTAFYRWTQLLSTCEVGGDPLQFSLSHTHFHAWCEYLAASMPLTLTSLTTHDNKRSADTRIALAAISEYAEEFATLERSLREATASARPAELDGRTEHILWQILAATFDGDTLPPDRLAQFLLKAMREAKTHTTWTEPNPDYEDAVLAFAAMVRADEAVISLLAGWQDLVATSVNATTLALTATWLTLPGIPDVYQGTEAVRRMLVDPDNRGEVDYLYLRSLAEQTTIDPDSTDIAAQKFALTRALLQLRARRPACFIEPGAGYVPLATTSGNVLSFARTAGQEAHVVTIAARLHRDVTEMGGWGQHTVQLPEGTWRDVLTGAQVSGETADVAALLAVHPVAVLERVDD